MQFPTFFRGILLLTLLTLSFQGAHGQEPGFQADPDSVSLDPMPIRTVQPEFPLDAAQRGIGGWVVYAFMIRADGSVDEPMVLDSSGTRGFETAGAKAAVKLKYKPAVYKGEPIDTVHRYKMTWQLCSSPSCSGITEEGSARPEFVTQHALAQQSLKSGDLEQARSVLDTLLHDDLSSYERVHAKLLEAAYYQMRQEPENLLAALRQATQYWGANDLDAETWRKAMAQRFAIAWQLGEFGEAWEIHKQLQFESFEGARDMLATLRPYADQIPAMFDSESPFVLDGQLGERSDWIRVLVGSTFRVTDISGAVDTAKLRCERGYAEWEIESHLDYPVAADLGICLIQLVGKRGATFRLHQF